MSILISAFLALTLTPALCATLLRPVSPSHHEKLGFFGAPTFTTADGELFWGNDRLEQALRWAKK